MTEEISKLRERFTAISAMQGVLENELKNVNITMDKNHDRIESALERFADKVENKLDGMPCGAHATAIETLKVENKHAAGKIGAIIAGVVSVAISGFFLIINFILSMFTSGADVGAK